MTNPVHLLLTPERADSVALIMKHVGQALCSIPQPHLQAQGHVMGRAVLFWPGAIGRLRAGGYRYIEMNPVRAGLVRLPRDYRWTSYHANAEGKVDPLISPHEEYLGLGSNPTAISSAVQGAPGQSVD
jgi:putative transposase